MTDLYQLIFEPSYVNTAVMDIVPQIRSGVPVLCMIASDIVIGLVKSFTTHSYESGIKLGELLCFIFAVVCDLTLPTLGIVLPVSITSAVAAYLVFMEIGSVIENIGVMNPQLGKYLALVFAKVKHPDAETEEEKETDADP